jgi:hypothetical protein
VGRTGSFIIVDAVTAALRRESEGRPTRDSSAVPSIPDSPSRKPTFEFPGRRGSQASNSVLNTATSAMNIGGENNSSDQVESTKEFEKSVSFLHPIPVNPSSKSLPSLFSSSPLSNVVSPMEVSESPTPPKVEAKATKVAKHLIEKKTDQLSMDVDPPEPRRRRPPSPTTSAGSGTRSILSNSSAVSHRSAVSGTGSGRSRASGTSGLSGYASGSASIGSGSVEQITIPDIQDRDERFTRHRGSVGPSDDGISASGARRPSMSSKYGSQELLDDDA